MSELDWKYVMVGMPRDKPFLVAKHDDGQWKYAPAWWDADTIEFVSGEIDGDVEPLSPWWTAWTEIPEPNTTNLHLSKSAE